MRVCVCVLDIHIRRDVWLCVSSDWDCWTLSGADVRNTPSFISVFVWDEERASPPHPAGTMRLELKKGTPA